ncbi:hypothetical protein CIK92_02000 [Prevotella sp. P4-67]|nr:hypothetical protein CIK92_02000 [Prevotella sp. P4-67]
MAAFFQVAFQSRRLLSLVCTIEHPVGTESDVCTVQPHGTSDIETASVDALTKLCKQRHHTFNDIGTVINRIVEILHTVLFTKVLHALVHAVITKVNDRMNAYVLYNWPGIAQTA